MSQIELVEKLAHALSKRMRPLIALAVDLWDIATVGAIPKAQYKGDAGTYRRAAGPPKIHPAADSKGPGTCSILFSG